MSAADNNINDVPDACANCGRGEAEYRTLRTCAACKMVKYCNRECQIAHRPQHKGPCKRRAAELHDEQLFSQPPPMEDCPICFQQMPSLNTGRTYAACCGKIICSGCIYAVQSRATKEEHDICPFCRTPPPATNEEMLERYKKRIELNDAQAMNDLGCIYRDGTCGVSQSYAKALELFNRAGEFGCAQAYTNIGRAYELGRGVGMDKKMAEHYYELAAMGGNACSRHNLGVYEGQKGNINRALKHYMIAVRGGERNALDNIQTLYSIGLTTKDDYTKALGAYQAYLGEIKSDQRDKAAEAVEYHKYY